MLDENEMVPAMQQELLLECGDIIVVPVESVLKAIKKDAMVKCKTHGTPQLVVRAGIPYKVRLRVDGKVNKEQRSMLED